MLDAAELKRLRLLSVPDRTKALAKHGVSMGSFYVQCSKLKHTKGKAVIQSNTPAVGSAAGSAPTANRALTDLGKYTTLQLFNRLADLEAELEHLKKELRERIK